MLIPSYNIMGLGGAPKKRAIHHLLKLQNPDIIMIQETMSKGWEAVSFVFSLVMGWSFCTLNVVG